MNSVKQNVINILIVIISFFYIDEIRYLLLFGNNIQNQLIRCHTNDIEIPNQNHHIYQLSDEEGINSSKSDTFCFSFKSDKFFFTPDINSQGFSDSIWQPPKIV
jgi:hypothetical protein